jgi:hypothetical protein
VFGGFCLLFFDAILVGGLLVFLSCLGGFFVCDASLFGVFLLGQSFSD